MSARRLIGSFLTVFTFHLVMVGPGDVCATHAHGSSESVLPTQMAMAHGSADAAVHHGESDMPCDTPNAAHCCDAFASCTVTVALGGNDPMPIAPTVALTVPASIDDPLVSRALGPEPPPPKL